MDVGGGRFLTGGNVALKDALQIACLSDTGKVRDLNEDSIAVRREHGVAVLADGMGGYNAGEVASSMAVELLSKGLARSWTDEVRQGLDRRGTMLAAQALMQQQVRAANVAIYERAQADVQCRGMGTTLVAGLLYDNFITVAHAGDARMYRLRGETLKQLTHDHSLLQEQIDCGMIRKEDAHLSANRNLVTRAIGVDPGEVAEIHSYDVEPDDIYLLCSDGLHGLVSDEDIQANLAMLKANLDLAAQQLIDAANDAGGTDNVSVVLIRVLQSFPAQ